MTVSNCSPKRFINVHHGVMRLVRRTTQRVGDEDNAKSPVNGAKDRAQHADIGFSAGDDNSLIPVPRSF